MPEPIGTAIATIKAMVDFDTDELARIIRDEIRSAQAAWCNALHHAMNAGDALIAVQPKVTEHGINWKKWLRENCLVADRTALLYMQLARHRDQIEAERQHNFELSLRAARKLISKRSGNGSAERQGSGEDQGAESLVDHWKRETVEARTALLDVVGVAGILEAMSDEFGRQLRARLPAPKRGSGKPFTRALNHRSKEREPRFRH
jgi:hypothetical protein